MADPNYLERELQDLIQSDPAIWQFIRETSLDGVWYWDMVNPEHEYMSPEFWRVFGFDPSTKQHLAAEWQDLIFPEDLETAKQNLDAHLADPTHPYDQIVRYKRADGGTAWVRCRGMAVRDKSGKPVRLLGAHNDLTALKTEENQAKMTAAVLSRIMETAQDAIIALTNTGQIASINGAGRHFLGGISTPAPFAWPAEIGFLETASLQPLEHSQDPVLRSLAGATLKGEVFLMGRPGSRDPRYVRVSSAPVNDPDSNLFSVVILEDVSEQEKNRQQIERTSRLDALGQLTGGIAHDFNNLLATVQYAMQLAKDTDDAARRDSFLETALSTVSRGAELTNRLLAFAKQQPGAAKSLSADAFIDDFRKLAKPVIESNITLNFDVATSDLWVYCDPAQLTSALLNLVLNARDAILRSGHGSRITISARAIDEMDADATIRSNDPDSYVTKGLQAEQVENAAKGDNTTFRYIEFAVADDGPGMSPEVKRRAIDPFFTTKEANSGTGLGLSMVYGFVQQANGELRIYSEAEEGTSIRLLLPRGTPHGLREAPTTREAEERGDGQLILVVEDEFNLRIMMEDLISSLGYTVDTAASGNEAISLIEQGNTYDLVITDIVMPGDIGGFALARKLRALNARLPLLYMSGYTGYSEDDMTDAVAPMLQKPCAPALLARAIATALRPEHE